MYTDEPGIQNLNFSTSVINEITKKKPIILFM